MVAASGKGWTCLVVRQDTNGNPNNSSHNSNRSRLQWEVCRQVTARITRR